MSVTTVPRSPVSDSPRSKTGMARAWQKKAVAPPMSVFRLISGVLSLLCACTRALAVTPTLEVLAHFEHAPLGGNYSLTPTPDGWYYGTSLNGLREDHGMFFRVNASGRLESLSPRVDGAFRVTGGWDPVAGSDGAVYHTDNLSGNSIHRFSEADGYTLVPGSSDLPGRASLGLMLAPDGNVYGATTEVLFRVAPGGVLSIVATFANPLFTYPNPAEAVPFAMGSDGALYLVGTSSAASSRSLIRVKTSGVQTVLATFGSQPGDLPFNTPSGSMAIGSDGALYGMSYPSTVLRIGTDGTVTPVAQWTENESFYSGFTAAPDGRLYSVGGTGEFGYGSIIRFTPGVGLSRVVSFTGKSGAFPGRRPIAQLSLRPDGSLIGVSAPAGAPGDVDRGSVFQILSNGDAQYLGPMIDADIPNAYAPLCRALAVGADGTALGFTGNNNESGARVIFSVAPSGQCTIINDFKQSLGTLPGDAMEWPARLPALSLADGSLLFGTVNVIDPNAYLIRRDSVGTVNLISSKDRFDLPDTYSGVLTPSLQRADGRVYGMGQDNSEDGESFVYRISAEGNFRKLAHFTGLSGELPGDQSLGWLTEGSDGYIYGCTLYGGNEVVPSGTGTIFRISPNDQVTLVGAFTGMAGSLPGSRPYGRLERGADGALYGVAQAGGTLNCGVLFQVRPDGTALTVSEFTGTAGSCPGKVPMRILAASNGDLIGVTLWGGEADMGTVFRIRSFSQFSSIASFTGSAGALPGERPTENLIEGADGVIYGTTRAGGAHNLGTIFRMRTDGVVEHVADFTTSSGSLPGKGSEATFLRRENAVFCSTAGGLFQIEAAGGLAKLLDLPPFAGPLTLMPDGSIIGAALGPPG